jgi:hypothetical protein
VPEGEIEMVLRVAAVIGAGQRIAGFTPLEEHRVHSLRAPKDRDFATALGPIVVTRDELEPEGFAWDEAVAWAGLNTRLRPGDLLVAPSGVAVP